MVAITCNNPFSFKIPSSCSLSGAYAVAKGVLREPLGQLYEGAMVNLTNKNWPGTVATTAVYHTIFNIKGSLLDRGVLDYPLKTPILTEFVYRGLIQELALKRIPEALIEKELIDPSWQLTPKQRVQISSTLYSFFKGVELTFKLGVGSWYYILPQVFLSYYSSHSYGAIKESKLGLFGSLGSHIASNTTTLAVSTFVHSYFKI